MRGDQADKADVSSTVEDRVFEIGEEYLDQLHAGEPPSAAWLITSQPEHAPYLERHLALVELLFRAGIS